MAIGVWELIAGIMLAGGLFIFFMAWRKLLHRWYVLHIRLPLIRRFRYRPQKPSTEYYRD